MTAQSTSEPAAPDAAGWALATLGAVTALNAAWMLIHPETWFRDLPAAVPDFGPYNAHFVRDIGCAFGTVALALLWAWRAPALRVPLTTLAAAFLGAHALLHVYDTARGYVDASHWWIDLPGVYLPAAISVALAWAFYSRAPLSKGSSHAS